jgi:ribulose-5-phosphate 4-epimerase/fuculose-1-phosphate aldolase
MAATYTYPPTAYDAVEHPPDDLEELRFQRKLEVVIGYRILAANRWGQLGDGHVTARDPILTDHFWVLRYGVPFGEATVSNLVLISPDRKIVEGPTAGGVNFAAFNIHHPIFEARPDVISACHVHTPYGTPWSANVKPFQPISQESCGLVYNQAMYKGEDLEVVDVGGGERIAEAIGNNRLVIMRNHGLLTAADSPAAAVGWFVTAERVAEVHVKAPNAIPISDEAARIVAETIGAPAMGWRTFQWLAREIVPDPLVVM